NAGGFCCSNTCKAESRWWPDIDLKSAYEASSDSASTMSLRSDSRRCPSTSSPVRRSTALGQGPSGGIIRSVTRSRYRAICGSSFCMGLLQDFVRRRSWPFWQQWNKHNPSDNGKLYRLGASIMYTMLNVGTVEYGVSFSK